MLDTEKEARKRYCANCGRAVYDDPDGLTVNNMDDTPHVCRESRPIGETLVGRCIEIVHIERAMTLTLDGGIALDVSGSMPLNVRLITPNAGVLTDNIGEAAHEMIISRMQLRQGKLTLYLEGGAILEATGGRLELRLLTPTGILEE